MMMQDTCDPLCTEGASGFNSVRKLLKEGDAEQALALLAGLHCEGADLATHQILLARAKIAARDFPAAVAALVAAESAGAERSRVLRVYVPLYWHMGRADAHRDALAELHSIQPDDDRISLALARSHLTAETPDAAAPLLDRLGKPGAHERELLQLRYEVALQRGDIAGIVSLLDAAIAGLDRLPRLTQLKVALREMPLPDRLRIVSGLRRRWPELVQRFPYLIRLTEGLERDAAIENFDLTGLVPRHTEFRRRQTDFGDGEVIVSPPGETGVTVLLFNGLADLVIEPMYIIDAFCAAAGHTLVTIRDPSRKVHLAGVGALAPDLAGSIPALRARLEELGTQRLFCIGASAGGFAAIRYASLLGAERMLGLAAPTTGQPEFRAGQDERRARLVAKRMLSQFGAEALDMRPDVLASAGATSFELWYGADAAIDAAHSLRLQDCAGVSCHALEGVSDHQILPHMVRNGALARFLELPQ